MGQSAIRALLVCVFIVLGLTSQACSAGSSIQGQVVDYYLNTPISGVKIIANTETQILEEKKMANADAKTDKGGTFRLKNLLPSKRYSITVSALGYSFQKIDVDSPTKQTKLIEQPIKIIKLPKNNGAYVFSSGKYIELKPFNKINRERAILDTNFAVEGPSIRYILENDLNEQGIPQVAFGSVLLLYGNQFKVFDPIWRHYWFPWYVHSLKKYPERSYTNGPGETKVIPESYYCGLDFVAEKKESSGHKYKAHINQVDNQYQNGADQAIMTYKLNLPPGKYVITNFHNDPYVYKEDYSEKWSVGFLFDVI